MGAFASGAFGSAPFGASASAESLFDVALSDSAALTTSAAAEFAPYLRERMTLTGSTSMGAVLNELLTATGDFDEAIVIAWQAFATATGAGSDTIATVHGFLGAITDSLVAAGLASSQMTAMEAVVAAAALETLVQRGFDVSNVDSAEFAPALVTALQAVVAAAATAAAADAGVPTMRLTAIVADEGEAGGDAAASMTMQEALADGATLFASIRLGGTEYAGWVLNAATRAVSTYTNYPFNSYATRGRKAYGAAEDGLYQIGGDDDAGTVIAAHVRTGLTNLGTNRMKRVPSAYWGIKTDGTMVVKVITTSADGAKVQDWYELVERTAGATRENRIKIGRGLKSVYWSFELCNKAGADFELDVLELAPMLLDRRI